MSKCEPIILDEDCAPRRVLELFSVKWTTMTRVKRLRVSHDCFGIGACHVKLRQRGAERLAASRD